MLAKTKLPLLILTILVVEVLIYGWAYWSSTFDRSNFFAIDSAFIFDKCARNSGRVSSFLNLGILLMIGSFGLTQIYRRNELKHKFQILITLFTVNHLTHFFFVYQTFKHHTLNLRISENLHGFITFVCILFIPMLIWKIRKMNTFLYAVIVLHLFNVSYFIMETFFHKVKPGKPAYHNQFGIVITSAACLYILYRIFREYRFRSSREDDVAHG